MKTKKLATELTNDELLKALNEGTIGDGPVDRMHIAVNELKFSDKIHAFISKYNIRPGEHKILSKQLYVLFKQDYPEYSLGYFTRRISNILPSERTSMNRTLLFIDKNVLDISKSVEKKFIKTSSTVSRQRNHKRHIEAFLKFFKIAPGTNAITFTIVADLYDRWTYKTKKKRMTNNILSTLLQMYLPHKKHNNERYFHINNDIFKVVSKRQLQTIRKNAKKTTT